MIFICFRVPTFLSRNAPFAERLTRSFVSRPVREGVRVFKDADKPPSYVLLFAVIPPFTVSVFCVTCSVPFK